MLFSGITALERIVVTWVARSSEERQFAKEEVQEMEEKVRLGFLSSLDERHKRVVEWWGTWPNFTML